MKLTRRQLTALLAVAPAAGRIARAGTQAPAATADSPEQLLEAQRKDAREGAAAVRKVKVPLDTEPAFSFRVQ